MVSMTSNTVFTDFRLRFQPAEIRDLVKRYGPSQDDAALKAGKEIRAGARTRAYVETIFRWKTKGRGISRLRKNSDEEIADALGLAVAANTDRAAISVLSGLRGADVPVASAILMAIDPERYTVIDFRALEALGNRSNNRSVSFYLEYLSACRQLAKEHQVSLRDLDRALWQWSSEQVDQQQI
jgi:hypothetical protein